MTRIPQQEEGYVFYEYAKQGKSLVRFLVALILSMALCLIAFGVVINHKKSEKRRLEKQYQTFKEYNYLDGVKIQEWVNAPREQRELMIHYSTLAR